MKKGMTELVFIVDRSGSMSGLENDTIGGFNATLKAHREAEGEAVVTTVLFDHEMKTLHDRTPITEVKDMTDEDYVVRGSTALLDAVGTTIDHITKIQGYMPDDYKPEHTIIVITTDGFENASRQYSYADIHKLISRKKELGWDFLFLGANIDAEQEAGRLGIDANHAATFLADGEGLSHMYACQAAATVSLRGGAPDLTGSWKADLVKDTASRGKKSRRWHK